MNHITRCDQCEMLAINGIATHELGCPNRHSRFDADDGTWIRQYECRECGCMIDQGENCSCFESTGEEEST